MEIQIEQMKKDIISILSDLDNSSSLMSSFNSNKYTTFLISEYPVLGYLANNDQFYYNQFNHKIIITRSTNYQSLIAALNLSDLSISNSQIIDQTPLAINYYTKFFLSNEIQYLIKSFNFCLSVGRIDLLFSQNSANAFQGLVDNYLIHPDYQNTFNNMKWSIIQANDSNSKLKLLLVGYQNYQIFLFDIDTNDISGNIPKKIIRIDSSIGTWSGQTNSFVMMGVDNSIISFEKQSLWQLKNIKINDNQSIDYELIWNQNLYCQSTKDAAIKLKDSSEQVVEKFDKSQNLLIQVQYYTLSKTESEGFSITIINSSSDEIINYVFIDYNLASVFNYPDQNYNYLSKYWIREVVIDFQKSLLVVVFENDMFLFQYPTLKIVQRLSYSSFVQYFSQYQRQIFLIVKSVDSKLQYQVYELKEEQLQYLSFFSFKYPGQIQQTAPPRTNSYVPTAFINHIRYYDDILQTVVNDRIVTLTSDPNSSNWVIDFYEGEFKLDSFQITLSSHLNNGFISETEFIVMMQSEIKKCTFVKGKGQPASSSTIQITSFSSLTNLQSPFYSALLPLLKIAVWSIKDGLLFIGVEIFDLNSGTVTQQIVPIPKTDSTLGGLFLNFVTNSSSDELIYLQYEPQQSIGSGQQYTYIYKFNSSTRKFDLYSKTNLSLEDFQILDPNQLIDINSYYLFQKSQSTQRFYFFDSRDNKMRYFFELNEQNPTTNYMRSTYISKLEVDNQETVKRLYFSISNQMIQIKRLFDRDIDTLLNPLASNNLSSIRSIQVFENYPLILVRLLVGTTHTLHLFAQDSLKPMYTENGWPLQLSTVIKQEVSLWSDLFELLVIYTNGQFRIYSPESGFKLQYSSQNLPSTLKTQTKIMLTYQPYILISSQGFYNYITNVFTPITTTSFVVEATVSIPYFISQGKSYLVIGQYKELNCFDISYIKYPTARSPSSSTHKSRDSTFVPNLLTKNNLQTHYFISKYMVFKISVDQDIAILSDRYNPQVILLQLPQMKSIQSIQNCVGQFEPLTNILLIITSTQNIGYVITQTQNQQSNNSQLSESKMTKVFETADDEGWILDSIIANYAIFYKFQYVYQNMQARFYKMVNTQTGESKEFESIKTNTSNYIKYFWQEKGFFITLDPSIINFGDIKFVIQQGDSSTIYSGINKNFNFIFCLNYASTSISHIDVSDLFPINLLRSTITNNQYVSNQYIYFNKTATYFIYPNIYQQEESNSRQQAGNVKDKQSDIIFTLQKSQDLYYESQKISQYSLYNINSYFQVYAILRSCKLTIFSSNQSSVEIISQQNNDNNSQNTFQAFDLISSDCLAVHSQNHQQKNTKVEQKDINGSQFFFHIKESQKLQYLRIKSSLNSQQIQQFIVENIDILAFENNLRLKLMNSYSSSKVVDNESNTPLKQYVLVKKIYVSPSSNLKEYIKKISYQLIILDQNISVIDQSLVIDDVTITKHLFFTKGDYDYFVIGTDQSTVRTYILNYQATPILTNPQISLSSGKVKEIIFVPEKQDFNYSRLVIITRNRIQLINGNKKQLSDAYLNNFELIKNAFMLTHTRYNLKASVLNEDLLAVFNYNQISLYRIGLSIIQFVGRIEEKYFQYIKQISVSQDNKVILVCDQENIYAFQMYYMITAPSSWIDLTNRKLPLIYTFSNLILPQIYEIINFQPPKPSNQTTYGIYKILGVSSKGLIDLQLNSNIYFDQNLQQSLFLYQPQVSTSKQGQCLLNIENNPQELWKQKQQIQNLFSSSSTSQAQYYSYQINQNNTQYLLPTFIESTILNNSTSQNTLFLDLQGNEIGLIQSQDNLMRNSLANIQFSNGILTFTRNNQINLYNLKSVILKNITLLFDPTFEIDNNSSHLTALIFSDCEKVILDDVRILNAKVVYKSSDSIFESILLFNNITSLTFNKLSIKDSKITNQNLINFQSCQRIILTQVTITNTEINDILFNFLSYNSYISFIELNILNSGINSAIKVMASQSFIIKNLTLEGIYQFIPTSNEKINRSVFSQNIENYLNDFYSNQRQNDFAIKKENVFMKFNLIEEYSLFENIDIKSCSFNEFINLKRSISVQKTDSQINTNSNKFRVLSVLDNYSISQTQQSIYSAVLISKVKLYKANFSQYFIFANENKAFISQFIIENSINPSILIENGNTLQIQDGIQTNYFVNDFKDYGVIIENLQILDNQYNHLPIIAIQNSILLLKQNKILSNTVNNNFIYSIDLDKTILKINGMTLNYNNQLSYAFKISNCDYNTLLSSQQIGIQNNNILSQLNITNQSYGGIYFINIKTIQIEQSLFKNIKGATKGGALKLYNIENMVIIDSVFEDNNALQYGGAIYLEESDLQLKEETKIENNQALVGGGIRYNNSYIYPTFLKDTSLLNRQVKNNKADIFGNNYGSFISSIKVANELVNITSSLNQKSINITFELYGEDGNLVKLDNYQKILRNPKDYQKEFLSVFQSSIFFMIRGIEQNSNILPIIYTQSNISSIIEGRSTLQFTINILDSLQSQRRQQIEIFSSSFYHIPNSTNQEIIFDRIKRNVPIYFRDCIQGEVIRNQDSNHYFCFECDSNTYSLSFPDMQTLLKEPEQSSCKECPSGAKYCNGNDIELMEGYWRDPGTDFIQFCYNSENKCTQINSKNGCSEGSIGPLCESCDYNHVVWKEFENKTYVKKDKYGCAVCKDSNHIINQYTLPIIGGIIFFLYLFYRIIKEHYLKIDKLKMIVLKKAEMITVSNTLYETEKSTILIKFFVGHLQMLSLISVFHIELPNSLQTSIFFLGNILETTYYSLDCALISLGLSKSLPMVYLRLIWNIVLVPTFMVISLLIFFGLMYYLSRKKGIGRVQRIRNLIASGLLKLYYMIFPGIVSQAIKTLACRNINNKYYLMADIQYLCYDNNYYLFNLLISIPILMLMILLPLGILRKLHKSKAKLYKINIFLTYSFYYTEYRSHCYYWEFIKIYLKILLFLCLNIFNEQPIIFGVLFSIIIITYIKYQQRIKPYRYNQFNYLDNLSLTACFLTIQIYILSSQNYILFGSQYTAKIICVALIVIVNFYLIIQFVRAIIVNAFLSTRQSLLKKLIIFLSEKFPHIFKDKKLVQFNFFRQSKNWQILKKNIRSSFFRNVQQEYLTKMRNPSLSAIQFSKSTNNNSQQQTFYSSNNGGREDFKTNNKKKILELKEEYEDNSSIDYKKSEYRRKTIQRQQYSNQNTVSFEINSLNNFQQDSTNSNTNNNNNNKQLLSPNQENNKILVSPAFNSENIIFTERDVFSSRVFQDTNQDSNIPDEEEEISTPAQNKTFYFDSPVRYNENKIQKQIQPSRYKISEISEEPPNKQ